MKIQFDDFEIEVKAKDVNTTQRFNKQSTMYLLNQISIWAHEASEHYKTLGLEGLSQSSQKSADEIYDTLKELGFYDNVK